MVRRLEPRGSPCRFNGLAEAAAETDEGGATDQHNLASRQPDAVDLILLETRGCAYDGAVCDDASPCRGAACRRPGRCPVAHSIIAD